MLTEFEALTLSENRNLSSLMQSAAARRDAAYGNVITYSRKVFIPLTELCRDVCHYCTFAKAPKRVDSPYMPVDAVLAIARKGVEMGCKEALFTLGERPELRYTSARNALEQMGFSSTLEYVAHVAEIVLKETGLLPHINAGCMDMTEIAMLRPVSASMGIMLESSAERLCQKGMPHYGSPDKQPARRLETIELAGKAKIPFTSGILIGIGETRQERIESLLALRRLHQKHGHLQEVIIQNFRAKAGTKMAAADEPDLEDLQWTIAVTRLLFGDDVSVQAPPNLNPGVLKALVAAGINDWGGVSPVTPDHVNPEAPWPHLKLLAAQTRQAGKQLHERLTLYPRYIQNREQWLDSKIHPGTLKLMDGEGFARDDDWLSGSSDKIPRATASLVLSSPKHTDSRISAILDLAGNGGAAKLAPEQIAVLFTAKGDAFSEVCQAADQLRQQVNGNNVSYVVTRNINYTNICYFKCRFCAFSKGQASENLREKPYQIGLDEIQRRCIEAWDRGATEVCLQGGIHPDFTGDTYLQICHAIKEATPDIHIHAFSPLEVWQGAKTLGLSLEAYLKQLKIAGLNSLPGTAAEILDDQVRELLCPDKINTREWLEVMETAHSVGLRSTATIMFGHVDGYSHWANHLLHVRNLQQRTGGFTELVPLPFVASEAPMYRRGTSRRGPTFREAILMHAVARLVLHPHITNIQTSWVKMGAEGAQLCLQAGANDFGGTLMNESITRAAGASHGQEFSPTKMERLIASVGRTPYQRTTLYQPAKESTRQLCSDYLEENRIPCTNLSA